MTTHRSWFPFILVGLSTALLALIVVVYDPSVSPPDANEPQMTAPTAAEYETAVQAIVTTYRATNDPGTAYDALIALRVPSTTYQQVHLDLVIAFGRLKDGKVAEGQAGLALAKNTYPWLGL